MQCCFLFLIQQRLCCATRALRSMRLAAAALLLLEFGSAKGEGWLAGWLAGWLVGPST